MSARGLRAELIISCEEIRPAEPFQLGLWFRHPPGYHTYWKNPGVVGLATAMTLNLPQGYEVGRLQWPYPEHSRMADYACYGYQRDVVLLVTVIPPDQLSESQPLLTADAHWMCCRDQCFPGFETLTLDWGKGYRPELIQAAAEEVPRPSEQWALTLLSSPHEEQIRLQLDGPSPLEPLHLFNADGQVSDAGDQEFEKRGEGQWRLILPRSEFSPEGVLSFPAVLRTSSSYVALEANYPSTLKGALKTPLEIMPASTSAQDNDPKKPCSKCVEQGE